MTSQNGMSITVTANVAKNNWMVNQVTFIPTNKKLFGMPTIGSAETFIFATAGNTSVTIDEDGGSLTFKKLGAAIYKIM